MSIQPSLSGLTKYKQWILWKAVKKPNGKVDKLPISAHSVALCNPHDPTVWAPYATVAAMVGQLGQGYGVGFVFTRADPFFFVDLDDCATPDGKWSDFAVGVCRHFNGAAQLPSSSGRGIHIIGAGVPQDSEHRCRGGGVELYTSGRFVALSQHTAVGEATRLLHAPLNTFIERYLGGDVQAADGDDWTVEAAEGYTGPTSDDELVKRALEAAGSNRAKFGGRPSFAELWHADENALGEHYPSGDSVRLYDESRADATLAADLAFWTGRNCERIEALMRSSSLLRDKWDNHPSYLKRTITGACVKTSRIYDIEKSVETQKGYFDGCVYITRGARMYMPNGELLKKEEFNGRYAGPVFWLSEKTATREPWKGALYADTPAVEKVDRAAFRPRMEPGEIFAENDLKFVNTFIPKFGARVAGDVTPFTEHMARLIPDDRDRDIFLSYLAACVQNYGHKFQWAAALIGPEGVGKTFLVDIVKYCIGSAYYHELDPKDIENRFNAWIPGKLLVVIEELATGGRYAVANALKPLITNKHVAVQAKGVDQTVGENYGNYLIFSNTKDAVMKMRNDRRYCIFYTKQQTAEDMAVDGMDQTYFRKLFKWRDEGGGMAAAAEYLWTRPINVDIMGRAPDTSSTDEAYEASMGPLEQWLNEAIENGEPGFKGDLIDRVSAAAYLKAVNGKAVTPRALTEIITNLDYVLPVALRDANKRLRLDGGREHMIYARKGSEAADIATRDELKAYWTEVAQT